MIEFDMEVQYNSHVLPNPKQKEMDNLNITVQKQGAAV